MKCRKCGINNPVNVNKCIYCGASLGHQSSRPPEKQRNSNNHAKNHSSEKGQRTRTDNIIICFIILLVVVLAAIIGIYAFNSMPKKSGFSSGGGGGFIALSSSGSDNSGAFTLEASKHELEVGTSDNVIYFYATPKGTTATVELTDDDGNVIIEMKDDGLYSDSGDDIANDGVYAAKVAVDVTKEQVLYYSAIVNSDKETKSNVEKINIMAKLTQTELATIRKVNASLKTMRESDSYKQLSIEEKRKTALAQLNQLVQEGLIKTQSIFDDKENNIISFHYSCGILGMEQLEEFIPVYAGNGIKGDAALINDDIELFAKINHNTQTQITADLGDALILYAWGDKSSDEWKGYYECCQYFQNKWDGLGLDTTLDDNVTINDLKNIKDKSFVYIAGHGTYSKFKYEYDKKYWFVFKTDSKKTEVTAPAVFFLEDSTESKDSEHSLDLKSGKIVIRNGKYGIVPAFFDEYYDSDDLENSIFFWGSCQLMGKKGTVREDWTTTLTSKSIKAFIGFHNSNYIAYHYNLLEEIVPALIEGKTINEALTLGTNAHGADDVQWYNSTHEDTFWENLKQWFIDDKHPHDDAAYPLLRGDKNATLINNNLINGNFEANPSVVRGWKKTGDVRLLTKLGEVVPSEGSQMTILTTGIGSGQSTYLNSTEGSSLYQAVKLGNKLKLSFDYNIISEEPTEYLGSQYDDKFYAEILNAKGEVIKTIASETVNHSTWFPVNQINFDGGDDTVFQTGWKNVECDLSDLKGQIVTIRFVVFDVGDSQYDTAAVVDNVTLCDMY